MNLDFLPELQKHYASAERTDRLVAASERLALEGLRDAGGWMTVSAFADTWGPLAMVMANHLSDRRLASCDGARVELTETGRGALQR